ncbi:MAG: hypothetical protein JO300_15900 [Silvibacterium sp.]|nr:hypothetical protein [Silvibacterium sp.]
MDTAFISALSALAGSIVGGLTSGATTWLGHRSQAKAGRRLHNVAQREILYRDFVCAASEAFGDALTHTEPQIPQIVTLYGMISRMRILSSPEVVACADKTINAIIDAYLSPNRTFLEIHTLIRNGEQIDPLKEFSEIARDELAAL